MTNYEKMLQLTGSKATKEQVEAWAYMNRVWVMDLHTDEPFEPMKESVKVFFNNDYSGDEHENWERFLECEYVEGD